MERSPISSSNIASVGYDAPNAILEIEFLSGGVYQYFGVPEHIYAELLNAGSAGGYFARHIKNVYRFTRIQ